MSPFHFTKKNALSILILLLIVISLVKPAILKKMVTNVLGRILLLFILVLLISYNVGLGLAGVLCIIIFYEYNDDIMEGMDNMPAHEKGKEKTITAPNDILESVKKQMAEKLAAPEKGGMTSKPAPVPLADTPKVNIDEKKGVMVGQKSDMEHGLIKPKSSSAMPTNMNKDTSNVKPSALNKIKTTTTESFGNMRPLGFAPF